MRSIVQFNISLPLSSFSKSCDSLSREDCKTIRSSIFGLVKYFLQREVSAKEVYPIVAYLQTERNESLVRELVEMLIHYLENRQVRALVGMRYNHAEQFDWMRFSIVFSFRLRIRCFL